MELDAVEMLSVSPKEREGMLSSLLSSGCLPGSSFQAPTRSSRHLPRATGTTESDDVDEVSSNFIAIHADERPAGAGVFSDTDDVFKCRICLDTMQSAYVTHCGHSFCRECITTHLETRQTCPICWGSVTLQQIFPGAQMARGGSQEGTGSSSITGDLSDALSRVRDQRQLVEAKQRQANREMLFSFLNRTREQKIQQRQKLEAEITLLSSDIDTVLEEMGCDGDAPAPEQNVGISLGKRPISELEGAENVNAKRRCFGLHFRELQDAYFDMQHEDFESFSKVISGFGRYGKVQLRSSIRYDDILRQSSTIISSIEFNGDGECFATAGVNCKIKIFNFDSIVNDEMSASIVTGGVYSHFPVQELDCNAKISCLSWNPHVLEQIGSTDSDGVVSLWNAHVGTETHSFREHTKRVWSIDFSKQSRNMIATGSDDCFVKLWSTNAKHSIGTIDCQANVCSVKFNPFQGQYVAFGCADRWVHYYDLRNTALPLFVMRDHKKAVSYVQFLSRGELVSSSTDSTLKLWNIESAAQDHCIRTYAGHRNVRNFVGMSTSSDDYIVCGSEDNSLYVYYKELSSPILQYSWNESMSLEPSAPPFVTSVCWRKDSNVIVGANSCGVVNVMELV